MKNKKNPPLSSESVRKYLSQEDVPSTSLARALRIAQAIADNYASHPSRPLAVAQAMDMSPSSGTFRMICGASIAYGLTEGGYNAATISLTELGKRMTKPLTEGDDILAKRDATLKPRVLSEFLTKYDGNKLPKLSIAQNVLESMGVPPEQAHKVFNLIVESARDVGFLREIKGDLFVDLDVNQTQAEVTERQIDEEAEEDIEDAGRLSKNALQPLVRQSGQRNLGTYAPLAASTTPNNKVYITHGKNRSLVPQISELLSILSFEAVVSVSKETVSKPVTDKVLDDMRTCDAAIIHIEAERVWASDDGSQEAMLNPNVLIEIGAALALFGRRFILLVQDGVKLPSNVHGLYEVRYKGDQLDAETTIKLLRSLSDLKNHSTLSAKAHGHAEPQARMNA